MGVVSIGKLTFVESFALPRHITILHCQLNDCDDKIIPLSVRYFSNAMLSTLWRMSLRKSQQKCISCVLGSSKFVFKSSFIFDHCNLR